MTSFTHINPQTVQKMSQRELARELTKATWIMIKCQATAWICVFSAFTLMPLIFIADRTTRLGISDGLGRLKDRLLNEHGKAKAAFCITDAEAKKRTKKMEYPGA